MSEAANRNAIRELGPGRSAQETEIYVRLRCQKGALSRQKNDSWGKLRVSGVLMLARQEFADGHDMGMTLNRGLDKAEGFTKGSDFFRGHGRSSCFNLE